MYYTNTLGSVLYSNRDFKLQKWAFPRRHLVLVPTSAAHLDVSFWNTRHDEHPLDTFWAERFLVYDGDSSSGPLKTASSSERDERSQFGGDGIQKNFRFKDSGLTDGFIPYGIGERTCPGKAFSRREIIAFCAIVVTNFDIELRTKQKDFRSSMKFFGVGTESPKETIPFKIRKRCVS